MNLAAIAIGGNLAASGVGGPVAVAEAAVDALDAAAVCVLRRSRWYWSAPVPAAAQPLFVNGVVVASTDAQPARLLAQLQAIETRFGRVRSALTMSRTLDLDLLAYGERILRLLDPPLIVPHPRLHRRAFALQPLLDVWPDWRHPVLGLAVEQLLARLGGDQWLQPIGG